MALHVDIIKTDPLANGERRLARAVLEDGELGIDETLDPAYWRATLAEATSVDPDAEPERFFEALAASVDGTYVYATQPHEDEDCPVTHPDAHQAATA